MMAKGGKIPEKEIESLKKNVYKWYGKDGMTGEHEIPASIGGIHSPNNIVHGDGRRPSVRVAPIVGGSQNEFLAGHVLGDVV